MTGKSYESYKGAASNMHELVEKMKNKEIRALAKAITMVENDHPDKLSLLSDVFSLTRKARYIGITGSPGADKSSVVNQLITHIRSKNLTEAVIAVDPTSPFSGGALLGDRMSIHQQHIHEEG